MLGTKETEFGSLLPTPVVSDHLHNQSESIENWKKRAKEKKKKGINLHFALRHYVQKNNKPGGKLNPNFVEFLMGFPMNWTKIEQTESKHSETQ